MTAGKYAGLLRRFAGQTVSIGSSRSEPPEGSLGEWVNEHIVVRSLGPMLVAEGYAERAGGDLITFR